MEGMMTGLYIALTIWGWMVMAGAYKSRHEPRKSDAEVQIYFVAKYGSFMSLLIGAFGLLGKATGWW